MQSLKIVSQVLVFFFQYPGFFLNVINWFYTSAPSLGS